MCPREFSSEELKDWYDFFSGKFSYNPSTGSLTHKTPRKSINIGKEVGSVDSSGYKITCLIYKGRQVSWYVHRICYLMYYGTLPDVIDHIDRDKLNNMLDNLRDGTGNNQKNIRSHKGSTSQYLGVSWYKRDKKWQSHIRVTGKKKHLGYFDSEIEAAKAYDREAKIHHKEFANLNFPEEYGLS